MLQALFRSIGEPLKVCCLNQSHLAILCLMALLSTLHLNQALLSIDQASGSGIHQMMAFTSVPYVLLEEVQALHDHYQTFFA